MLDHIDYSIPTVCYKGVVCPSIIFPRKSIAMPKFGPQYFLLWSKAQKASANTGTTHINGLSSWVAPVRSGHDVHINLMFPEVESIWVEPVRTDCVYRWIDGGSHHWIAPDRSTWKCTLRYVMCHIKKNGTLSFNSIQNASKT